MKSTLTAPYMNRTAQQNEGSVIFYYEHEHSLSEQSLIEHMEIGFFF